MPLKLPPSVLKDKKTLEDYVHKHIFPKVSPVYRAYLAQFFTVLFAHGFEGGNFGNDPETGYAWTGTVVTATYGSLTVETSQPHHGTYSASSSVTQQTAWTNAYCYYGSYSSPLNKSTLHTRAYFYIDSMTAGEFRRMIHFMAESGDYEIAGIGLTSARALNLRYRSGTSTLTDASLTTLNLGTWYCVELEASVGDGTGSVKVYLNGSEVTDITQTDLTNNDKGNIDQVNVGLNNAYNAAISLYFDCVVVADAYIGPEEEGTLVEVADSLELAEALLRNKTVTLSDSLGLADSLYGNKSLLLSDSASLSELVTVIIGEIMKYITDSVNVADLPKVLKTLNLSDTLTLFDAASTPSRVLRALDAVGLTDDSFVNKTLQINEIISLAEVVEVGAGGVKKTRLFLIIGDLAVQLTGD